MERLYLDEVHYKEQRSPCAPETVHLFGRFDVMLRGQASSPKQFLHVNLGGRLSLTGLVKKITLNGHSYRRNKPATS